VTGFAIEPGFYRDKICFISNAHLIGTKEEIIEASDNIYQAKLHLPIFCHQCKEINENVLNCSKCSFVS